MLHLQPQPPHYDRRLESTLCDLGSAANWASRACWNAKWPASCGLCSNWKSLAVSFLSGCYTHQLQFPEKCLSFSKLALHFPLTKTDVAASINKQKAFSISNCKMKIFACGRQIPFISKRVYHSLLVTAQWLRFAIESKLVCFSCSAQKVFCFFLHSNQIM